MLGAIVKKVIGTKNDRELKRLWPLVDEINSLEEEVAQLSDADLRARTAAFKEQLDQGATLDDILPEAFATEPRGGRARAGHAPLRRAADRRHGAAPRARSPR